MREARSLTTLVPRGSHSVASDRPRSALKQHIKTRLFFNARRRASSIASTVFPEPAAP